PMTLVSQGVAGQRGTVYYVTSFRISLADFDKAPSPLKQVLGEEGYERFQKSNAEDVQFSEVMLSRFLPEMSNPPQEVAEASPEFWNPKPAIMKTPTVKPSGGSKSGIRGPDLLEMLRINARLSALLPFPGPGVNQNKYLPVISCRVLPA